MKKFQKVISLLLLSALLLSLAACGKKETTPTKTTAVTEPTQATESSSPTEPATQGALPLSVYNPAEDAPFLPKDIFSNDLYYPGMTLGQSDEYNLDVTEQTDVGAFVLAGEYGKCYEIKVPAGTPTVKAAKIPKDPRTFSVGTQLPCDSSWFIKTVPTEETNTINVMYVCRELNEYLVLYTGTSDPVYIGERTIIQDTDTESCWYIPEPVGDVAIDKTLGDVNWTSEEVIDNLYEPVRARHPNYIARENIGMDETGTYNMYCYTYTPENYEITMFLASGVHGDEEVGYFSLAKLMQLIADATPEDEPLYTLRKKVRFVVIPIVNVWSVSTEHIRQNSTKTDLNRDFDKRTQQETRNAIACFDKYAKDVCTFIDFHIAGISNVALYFNFINYADNAVANYKTTNHMYHRYLELGYTSKITPLAKVPGSYTKGSMYFEGCIWNNYGIPATTIEYVTTSSSKFPKVFSDKCMTLAVETYANFVIQNALFYLQ